MNSDLNQDSGGAGLVVGLDAGGTRTRAVLAAAADGRSLGEGAAGPGNALTVPVPQLTEHLTEAVAAAVPESARGRVVAVAGGFAGATAASPDEPGHVNARAALADALRRLGIVTPSPVICSDIEAAFASAPGAPADGLALVAGTGAVAMRITDRRATTTVDGDGWLLGDDGSGFWIGRAAVRAALRMADGRGPETVLADAVGRALGLPGDVLPYDDWTRARREAYRMHLLPAVMAEPPIRLARFAPLVAEAARDKDAVAEAILDEAADRLAETVRALNPQESERIVATGGLLGPEGPLTTPLTSRLHTLGLTLDWVADGCRGAVALARLSYGGRSR
ncbi:N-acetylglucosamine kinase [Streptomyces fulvoviolaceus]|uniref:N-acetylglucosamine kinase n=1 Tax=Streptomyces fulvoviolaceus TaxID=285535 RepID=UPI0021C1B5C4|nr:BadF/BadG/BcrA/BcrD ATPase family protein [Streptomyces fulvoviolaceus]MCT9080682.1 ATPase [Streptomyces fulvoviolaceus]